MSDIPHNCLSDIPHNCLSEIESEVRDSSDDFMSFDSSSDESREDKPKFRKYTGC